MEANGIPHAPLEARRSLRVGLVRDIFDTVTRSKECFLNNFQLPASHIEPLFNTRLLGSRGTLAKASGAVFNRCGSEARYLSRLLDAPGGEALDYEGEEWDEPGSHDGDHLAKAHAEATG